MCFTFFCFFTSKTKILAFAFAVKRRREENLIVEATKTERKDKKCTYKEPLPTFNSEEEKKEYYTELRKKRKEEKKQRKEKKRALLKEQEIEKSKIEANDETNDSETYLDIVFF